MSMYSKFEALADAYDILHEAWERPALQRFLSMSVLLLFFAALIGIELNRAGHLPGVLAAVTPTNHFQAITVAFTLILAIEILSLILTISCSISKSMGKQFEIMALILLRNAFKELSYMPEPVSLVDGPEPVMRIALSAMGALAIFFCLAVYKKMPTRQRYIKDVGERVLYVLSKKMLALALILIFVAVAAIDAWIFLTSGQSTPFFETIYTVLIFADITLVLLSQRFMPCFQAVFRNSAYVIATLVMRLSLSAPSPWDVAACLFAALYVLALTWAIRYSEKAA